MTHSNAPHYPTAAPMVVADPLARFQREGMVKLLAPAKVNLYLNVGNKREDGYHEATTVMHALALHDVLHMDRYAGGAEDSCSSAGEAAEIADQGAAAEVAEEAADIVVQEPTSADIQGDANTVDLRIEAHCFAREGLEELKLESKDNIVHKAIELLANKIGRRENERIVVRIEKHIPDKAGLGGGSSDAAAALLGAAKLWGLPDDAPEILEAAYELGADVAFFLHGGCTCLTGAGEQFHHALEPMKKTVVLVKPEGGVSTAAAYCEFDKNPVVLPCEAQETVLTAQSATEVPLLNNLTGAARSLLPALDEILVWTYAQDGVEDSMMSGSGSAVFAVCDSFDVACRVSAAAREKGWWARTTAFSTAGASVVPR